MHIASHKHTHSIPKKTNLVLNIMFSSTTNLDMIMSRYVIVENV